MPSNPELNKNKYTRSPGLFSAIFPREYDFHAMLDDQAGRTVAGVRAFAFWMESLPLKNPAELERIETEVDAMRHDMEEKLISSFSTPFDRQDIYSISRQMDYILNSSRDTAREMYAFGVVPDLHIHAMAGDLVCGTECIGRGIGALDSDKDVVEDEIRKARDFYNALEDHYIAGMTELLKTNDVMHAMRTKEIYHHLRDAGRAMRDTLDILHNAVIDLA
ncbi:MAG: DUF47 family protein [Methanomicrobiales archaeon]|nr:DUF47 family protein [Methanomicrobiales archaeon]